MPGPKPVTKYGQKELVMEMLRSAKPDIRTQTRDGITAITVVWRLDDSKLWYLNSEQIQAYLGLGEDYKKGMHYPEINLIERNIVEFVDRLPDCSSFVDLGCGEALKTVEIVAHAQEQGRRISFYPVDISQQMLEIATKNAAKVGVAAHPLNYDFEQLNELVSLLPKDRPIFFNLGANFANFDRKKILDSVAGVMKEGDSVYFSAQLSDTDIAFIVKGYCDIGAKKMVLGVVNSIGFKEQDVDYGARFNTVTREIELYIVIKCVPEGLETLGMKPGDEILVIKSYKPGLSEFMKDATQNFSGNILSNDSGLYVGFLGSKKNGGQIKPRMEDSTEVSSAHYTAEKYRQLIGGTTDEGLKAYMKREFDFIDGIAAKYVKTFVDLGAGYGRVVPFLAERTRNVIPIELNKDMFRELERVCSQNENCTPTFGDMHNLRELLSGKDVEQPVFLILQNTLAVISNPEAFLVELASICRERKGEVIISLLRQEALQNWGVDMYRSLQEMVGEPDLSKTNFEKGLFISKTGYISKWWSQPEITRIKKIMGGEVVNEEISGNYQIIHMKF